MEMDVDAVGGTPAGPMAGARVGASGFFGDELSKRGTVLGLVFLSGPGF